MANLFVNHLKGRGKVSFGYWGENQPLVEMRFHFHRKVMALDPAYLMFNSYDIGCFYHPHPLGFWPE
jgi:hypothetical protein